MGYQEIVKILIENGADVNITDVGSREGNTALIIASMEGRVEIVTILIENGALINITDEGGASALMWASEQGHLQIKQAGVQD